MDLKRTEMKVEVKLCPPFLMYSFAEVKEFIEKDLHKYRNVIKSIDLSRDEPAICLVDFDGQLLREIPIGRITRKECNNILLSFGIKPVTHGPPLLYSDLLDFNMTK